MRGLTFLCGDLSLRVTRGFLTETTDADLRDADLRQAILTGAKLDHANLEGADLSGVRGLEAPPA